MADHPPLICIITCDNCGRSVISDPDQVDLFFLDDVLAIAVCERCNQPVVKWIATTDAKKIAKKGVKVFSFLTGDILPEEAL